jgi:ABC-2 type transport system ATP-binding protein
MSAIEVDRLTVRYGDVVAVRDVSFTAEAGAVTCLLGRNGAGKTSIVEALSGLLRPASGRLSVLGFDPQRQRQRRRLARRMGVMLQEVGVQPAARVGELARHAAALYPRSVAPSTLLDRVGLAGLERRTFRQLSGGEQRRLALALALVGQPQVAFLDEPTTGVDPEGRQVVRAIVGELRDQGVTVLLSTHDLAEAQRLADKVLVVHGGELRADGTVAELTASAGPDARTMRFRAPTGLDTAGLAEHLSGPHHQVPVRESAAGEYVVTAEPTPWLLATVMVWLAERDITLSDMDAGGRSLEDAFVHLTAPAGEPPGRDGSSSNSDGAATASGTVSSGTVSSEADRR